MESASSSQRVEGLGYYGYVITSSEGVVSTNGTSLRTTILKDSNLPAAMYILTRAEPSMRCLHHRQHATAKYQSSNSRT